MKNSAELVEAFILLRSQGLSLSQISEKINVSKPTLIKWCKSYELEIHNEKSLIVEELRESFRASRRNHLEDLLNLSQRVDKELGARNLSDIPTEKLIKLSINLKEEVDKCSEHKFKTRLSEMEALDVQHFDCFE